MSLPLCIRIKATDQRSADALRQDGWREVEVLETWRANSPFNNRIHKLIRPAKPSDNLVCQKIASQAFMYDRLHMDPCVSDDEANDAKRAWVNGAFTTNLPNLFVYDDSIVKGFISMKIETNMAIVDLVAVDPVYHGKGIGRALVCHAQTVYPHINQIQAGTQEINVAGRALYASLGFAVVDRQRTFHKIPSVTQA